MGICIGVLLVGYVGVVDISVFGRWHLRALYLLPSVPLILFSLLIIFIFLPSKKKIKKINICLNSEEFLKYFRIGTHACQVMIGECFAFLRDCRF